MVYIKKNVQADNAEYIQMANQSFKKKYSNSNENIWMNTKLHKIKLIILILIETNINLLWSF